MHRRLAIAALACSLAIPASAQIPPIVQRAFDAVNIDVKSWAYTQTTVEEGTRTVEKFDPSRPVGQQWQLVSKNGHAPTSSELSEYAKEKAEKGKKSANRKEMKVDLSEMIRPGSLRMIRETPAEVFYEFRLPADGGDDPRGREMVDLMRGRLTIAKNGPSLQVLEIENEKPIAPVFSVKLERMYTKMTFRSPGPGFPPLPAEVHVVVRGRALFVKKLDTDSTVIYSDYRAVNPAK